MRIRLPSIGLATRRLWCPKKSHARVKIWSENSGKKPTHLSDSARFYNINISMAQIQSNSLINASNVVSSFFTEVVSVNSSGTGATVAKNNNTNLADAVVWGPTGGGLGQQWPTMTAAEIPLWQSQFSGGTGSFALNRTGAVAAGSNAWATGSVTPTNFNSAAPGTPQDPVYASKYSGSGVPSSTALLYTAARQYLSINWTTATRYLLGGSPTVYGPFKGTFNTAQFSNNFNNSIVPLGYDGGEDLGSVADSTYGAGNTVANPSDQTEWGINNYFQALKTAFNSRPVSTVSITVCHSSCHSSCHGSRGRR